jgi:hypothetical protein
MGSCARDARVTTTRQERLPRGCSLSATRKGELGRTGELTPFIHSPSTFIDRSVSQPAEWKPCKYCATCALESQALALVYVVLTCMRLVRPCFPVARPPFARVARRRCSPTRDTTLSLRTRVRPPRLRQSRSANKLDPTLWIQRRCIGPSPSRLSSRARTTTRTTTSRLVRQQSQSHRTLE